MDRRVLAAIGIIVTAALMLAIVACIVLYTRDPDNESYVMAMSMLSMGIMLFLLIFGMLHNGRCGIFYFCQSVYNRVHEKPP